MMLFATRLLAPPVGVDTVIELEPAVRPPVIAAVPAPDPETVPINTLCPPVIAIVALDGPFEARRVTFGTFQNAVAVTETVPLIVRTTPFGTAAWQLAIAV